MVLNMCVCEPVCFGLAYFTAYQLLTGYLMTKFHAFMNV